MAKINNFKPDQKTTIPEFVDAGKKLLLSHESVTMKYQLNDNTIIPMGGLVQKHATALRDHIVDMELTDAQYDRYMYKPKLLCIDLYGTPEFWADILYINKMVSVTEFNKKKIKVFRSNIVELTTEILMIYESDKTRNRATITI